jgi:hypothetical protein
MKQKLGVMERGEDMTCVVDITRFGSSTSTTTLVEYERESLRNYSDLDGIVVHHGMWAGAWRLFTLSNSWLGFLI